MTDNTNPTPDNTESDWIRELFMLARSSTMREPTFPEFKAKVDQMVREAELRGEYNGLQRALLAEPKGESPDFVTMMLTTCNYVTERLKEIEAELSKKEQKYWQCKSCGWRANKGESCDSCKQPHNDIKE